MNMEDTMLMGDYKAEQDRKICPWVSLPFGGYSESVWRVPVKKQEYWCESPCLHPSHNPPGHMVIKGCYIHKCPGCGKETVIRETYHY